MRAVLFDMDGLMFDTEQLSTEGWLYAARERGWPITAESVARMRGMNVSDGRALFKKLFGDAVDYEQARALRQDYIQKSIRVNGVPVKPGLRELLDALRERGIPASVATATSRASAESHLRSTGVLAAFDARVFGDEVVHSKPAPDIFLLAAARLERAPETCMVLEDSPNGIRAAHAAGCIPVMVPDLTPCTPDLEPLCAACVKSLHEVIPLLDRL